MEYGQILLDLSLLGTERTYGDWIVTHKGDHSCRLLSDRHYSRRSIGAKQFTRPGENLVLRTADGSAVFVSWKSKFKRRDRYNRAWECSIFRNENPKQYLSSNMIKYALYATYKEWGEFPDDGYISYVDPASVQSKNAGYCFERAGFVRQPVRSQRGYICYKTEMASLKLILEEMSIIHHLEFSQYNISLALNSGEFMEAYEFQEAAEEMYIRLFEIKKKMKDRKLKAWSQVNQPISKKDLDLITDPYSNWMADKDYFESRGIYIDWHDDLRLDSEVEV
ncbi:hypothetical protein ACQKFO_21665 [Rossellomorea sp. NPDC071047]|uniref:hypothetical protein n=1 Tax=Rossellomorea sp. NPDC071047 TaxID=3390675 RepID=UPI003D08E893